MELLKLKSLQAEFFLNVCDLPLSFDSWMGKHIAGLPVFGTERMAGSSMDILVPDPLDLSANYFSSSNATKASSRDPCDFGSVVGRRNAVAETVPGPQQALPWRVWSRPDRLPSAVAAANP